MTQRDYPCAFCDTDQDQLEKRVSVTRTRDGKFFVFDDVTAHVCPNCGHKYFGAAAVMIMEEFMKNIPANAERIEAYRIPNAIPSE